MSAVNLRPPAGRCLAPLAASFAVVVAVAPSFAATLHVPAEYPTINSGLAASVSGDTVLVAPGVYTDADSSGLALSCAYLVGGVKLVSEGGPEMTTIDMQGAEAFFANPVRAAFSDEPMWIQGFTITGSPQGHAAIAAGTIPKLTVKDCVIRDIDANPVAGGGISAADIDLDVIGCRFVRCRAFFGAAIGVGPCVVNIQDSTFEECEDNAVQIRSDESGSHDESLIIENSRFLRNHTPDAGGAIVGAIRGDILIRGCWFEENTSGTSGGGHGGAIWFYGPWGARTVENCVFWKNEAFSTTSMAGGIYAAIETEIDNCTFVANSQGRDTGGAAVTIDVGGTCWLRNCILTDSQPAQAVAVRNGILESSCNTFWNNAVPGGSNWTPDPTDFQADPLFCSPDAGNFELSSQSPCLPPASGACGLIGAFGQGCGTVSIEDSSWGQIKAQYIDRSGGER